MAENFLTGKTCCLPALLMPMLGRLGEPTEIGTLSELLSDVPDRDVLVKQLLDYDVLVRCGSELDFEESRIDCVWTWGHAARYYHFSTNVREFESRPDVQRAELTAWAADHPPPDPYKSYRGRVTLALGQPDFNVRTGGLWDLLRERRTCRSFQRKKMELQTLSDLLLWTWGKTGERSDPALGTSLVKTSPSGGSRHPIEVYPVVLSVEGVIPGVYHYSVRDHALTLLLRGQFRDVVNRLCCGQHWLRETGAVFFMTAVVERSMWKYRDAHAYRVLYLDAGHLGQTFHLVSTALGLSPFSTAATRNTEINELLGLDGISETALYTVAAGTAKETAGFQNKEGREGRISVVRRLVLGGKKRELITRHPRPAGRRKSRSMKTLRSRSSAGEADEFLP